MAGLFRPPPAKEPEEVPAVTAGPEPHIRWRQEQLLKAGYDEVQAALIAGARHIDLHKAVKLGKEAGPTLATKILL